MFNLFKKLQTPSELKDEESYEQAVILEIPLESGEDFGSEAERNSVFSLEQSISPILNSNEVMDGHEFGEGIAIIYLYGPSADGLFESVKDTLQKSDLKRFEVTIRYGRAEDSKSEEKHFTLSW